MDDIFGILTLVALAAVALLVAVPFLLFSHLGLKAKMRDLEQIVLRNRADLARLLDGSATDGLPHATGVVAHTVAAQDTQRRSPHLPDRQDDHSPAEAVAQVALPSAESSAEPPKAFVFKPDLIDRLTRWLRENWVLAIAAASLVMAGVFMVQYGVEHGLLTPFWRVMGASGFGAALIGAGEYIRRRASDDEGATKYLPSTLSGAGIVVLYAAVFSAAALYGLIGATALLIGLMAVSALALVLGWFHGPFLAAIGIIGACVAPFLTGGSSDSAWAMQYGFAMIAIVALGIDTVKRWAWISVLGLVAPIAATWLLYLITSADLHFLTAGLIITLAAFIIPERNLTPHHAGAAVLDMLLSKGRYRPEFPTRLSFGATLATTVAAVCIVVDANSAGVIWLSFVTLIFLLVATVVWARQATALYDHALIPGVGFLVAIALEGLGY
ncbi:DUF2339 domain-containing protein, partial [Pseudorhodobacter sp.]|uniref:DUF2339 domain-containing protein n=1 Tax=Pseudorhodobacter sp. TaxID=1934400 RepID=UPI00264914F7